MDGIYTADPRLIGSAVKLERIDFRDMLSLARSGSQVLHSKSVELALANEMDIQLLPAFQEGKGSLVCRMKDSERPVYAGVTRSLERSELSLAGKGADASALSSMVILLSQAGIAVTDGRLSEGCAAVKVAPAQLEDAMVLVHDKMLLGLLTPDKMKRGLKGP